MRTKYDIGQIVFIPVEVVSAHIDKEGIYYKVRYNDRYQLCVASMKEEQLFDKHKEDEHA